MIVKFCNKYITEGDLSTEILQAEIKSTIIHKCYEALISESPEEDRLRIISCTDVLNKNGLKTIRYSTTSR